MVNKCLKKLIGIERLSFTELPTALIEMENVLNNRPLCFMYNDDVSEVLNKGPSTVISKMASRKVLFM